MIKIRKTEQRDLLYLLFGKVITVLIALLSVRIATTLLNAEELGKNYLLLTLITLMSFTFFSPIGQYFSRKAIEWNRNNSLKSAIHALISIRIVGLIIAVLVSILVYSLAGYEKYFSLDVYAIFLFFALTGTTTILFFSIINTLGNRLLFTKLTILLSLLSIAFSSIYTLYIDATGLNWLYGIVTAQLLLLLPSYYLLVHNKKTKINFVKKINRSYCKTIFYFIAPITLTLFLQWGQNSAYRVIVEIKYSVELLGMMGVGFAVSTAVFTAIDNIATQYFNPLYLKSITGANKSERASAWNNYSFNMYSIYIATLAFIVGTSPFLLKLLVDEKFYHVYSFVMLGALVDFFRVSSNVVYMVSQSEINTKTTILPYAIGFMLLVLTLSYFDFSQYNFMIPLLQTTTYCVIFILLYINMKKILPIRLNVLVLFKAVLASSPLYLLFLVPRDISISYSLLSVFIAGIYFLLVIYNLVFKKQFTEI